MYFSFQHRIVFSTLIITITEKHTVWQGHNRESPLSEGKRKKERKNTTNKQMFLTLREINIPEENNYTHDYKTPQETFKFNSKFICTF